MRRDWQPPRDVDCGEVETASRPPNMKPKQGQMKKVCEIAAPATTRRLGFISGEMNGQLYFSSSDGGAPVFPLNPADESGPFVELDAGD